MKRRLFIAIPIPERAKKEINYALDRVDNGVLLCGRLIPESDWHITLKFFGEQDEKLVDAISRAMENLRMNFPVRQFEAVFTGISFNPTNPPRMIWANCSRGTSKFLGEMKDVLDQELAKEGICGINDFKHNTLFTAHVTLVRFSENLSRGAAINESVNVTFNIKSLDLMDSKLQRGGPVYTKLNSAIFT